MDEKMKWETPELGIINIGLTESGDVNPVEIATSAGPS